MIKHSLGPMKLQLQDKKIYATTEKGTFLVRAIYQQNDAIVVSILEDNYTFIFNGDNKDLLSWEQAFNMFRIVNKYNHCLDLTVETDRVVFDDGQEVVKPKGVSVLQWEMFWTKLHHGPNWAYQKTYEGNRENTE